MIFICIVLDINAALNYQTKNKRSAKVLVLAWLKGSSISLNR